MLNSVLSEELKLRTKKAYMYVMNYDLSKIDYVNLDEVIQWSFDQNWSNIVVWSDAFDNKLNGCVDFDINNDKIKPISKNNFSWLLNHHCLKWFFNISFISLSVIGFGFMIKKEFSKFI
jgi:hypothetical protein